LILGTVAEHHARDPRIRIASDPAQCSALWIRNRKMAGRRSEHDLVHLGRRCSERGAERADRASTTLAVEAVVGGVLERDRIAAWPNEITTSGWQRGTMSLASAAARSYSTGGITCRTCEARRWRWRVIVMATGGVG
jgi:hypothetical protein